MTTKIKTIIVLVAIMAIGGVSYFAIAQSNDTPENSITAFYDNAKQGNLDGAKKYVASELLEYYKNPNWTTGTISTAIKREANTYKKVEPKEGKAKINGDVATVPVKVTHPDGSIEIKDYTVIKEDGAWKLTFQ